MGKQASDEQQCGVKVDLENINIMNIWFQKFILQRKVNKVNRKCREKDPKTRNHQDSRMSYSGNNLIWNRICEHMGAEACQVLELKASGVPG